MGVNSRAALDPRWTTLHTKVVKGFMLATISVIRKLPNVARVYNQETGTWTTDGFLNVGSFKARIQPYGIIGDEIVAQDTTGRRLMRVQIAEKVSGIQLDDMITVIASPEDTELLNFTMEVRGTITSSNAWLTDLVCEANLKANNVDNTFRPSDNLFPSSE